jgi:hypothetical protein
MLAIVGHQDKFVRLWLHSAAALFLTLCVRACRCVAELIRRGADTAARDSRGRGFVQRAILSGSMAAAKTLVLHNLSGARSAIKLRLSVR